MSLGHLSEEQILAFKARTLSPSELLQADDHLSSCSACRDRLWNNLNADRMVASLRNQLHSAADPSARRKGPTFRWTAAAAIVLIASAAAGSLRLFRSPEAPAPAAQIQPAVPQKIPAPLPPEYQEALDIAKREGKVERASVLNELIRKEGTLLAGGSAEPSYSVVAPAGTIVLTDRPWLKWQAVPGATRYFVSIFDADFNNVAQSPSIAATEWQVVQPLPRGISFTWQVTATVKGDSVRFPKPPAPEAVFRVLDSAKADELERTKQLRGESHLLMGILYAREGLLDDAEIELKLADPVEARKLLESLSQIRK